jgi:three-Cys-motif partner protein
VLVLGSYRCHDLWSEQNTNMSEPLADDGLIFDDVGRWAEEKHAYVAMYSTLFSTGMKNKWPRRTYVELHAGSGHSRIRETRRVIAGSPILALGVPDRFDQYVFCEKDRSKMDALRARVLRIAPTATVTYIQGDCDRRAADIVASIPGDSLTLCFVDPYGIGINFETLRVISAKRVDFLVLLAVFMDANRNYDQYLRKDNATVDRFLGSNTWREKWGVVQLNAVPFPQFLAAEFASSMERRGYMPTPLHKMKKVRSDEKNLPLYYLALFSKHETAYKFWDEVLKYGTDQRTLFPQ